MVELGKIKNANICGPESGVARNGKAHLCVYLPLSAFIFVVVHRDLVSFALWILLNQEQHHVKPSQDNAHSHVALSQKIQGHNSGAEAGAFVKLLLHV
jgi:hypothetical protein